MRRRLPILAVLLALLLIAAACGEGAEETTTTAAETTTTAAETTTTTAAETTTTEPAGPKTVIIGTTDSLSVIDSADAYAVHGWEIIRNTGEPLLKFKPGTVDLEEGIAGFPEISDDGTVYTFTLKDGVTFGDGTPLTASDYVAHVNRMLNLDGSEGVGSALGKPYIVCNVEGEEEGSCDEWAVEAPDDKTVVFNLTGAFAYFSQLVTGAGYVPMHPDFPADAIVDLPEPPYYGVGPWIVADYSVGEQTVLEPNPFYHGDAPLVDQIIIRYFEEAQQLVLALENQEIDIAWRSVTEPGLLEQLAGVDGIVSATVPGGAIRYFLVNHNLGATVDVNVRKAIAAAIDRDEIVDRALGGRAAPLWSPVPPGFLGENASLFDDLYESPNPDLAAEFLAEAGYTPDNPLDFTVNYPPNRYGGIVGDAMQIIKENLEATGAMNVTLEATEWATYLGEALGGESYSLSFLGWFFDYPDVSNYLEPFSLFGGLGTMVTDPDTNEPNPNLIYPDMIQDIVDAASIADLGEREAAYEAIQDLWGDDVVTIPLWIEPERVFYWDYVTSDPNGGSPISLNIGPDNWFHHELLDISK
jgi:peptide/nickel transport system substrate-binding protein